MTPVLLLPPSEGKTAPVRGASLRWDGLTLADDLTEQRRRVLDALTRLCRHDPSHAASVLGLGPTQGGEVARNACLAGAPTTQARRVYSGVLYESLGLASLPAHAARRSARSVLIFSGLFGVLRPTDRIPAYRLAGAVRLPGVSTIAPSWRHHLDRCLPAELGRVASRTVVLDLRSGPYVPMWRPPAALRQRTLSVRVVRDAAGGRTAVSHQNKATKGALARDLLLDPASPRSMDDLLDHLRTLGWSAERGPTPGVVDVVEAPPAPSAPPTPHAPTAGVSDGL